MSRCENDTGTLQCFSLTCGISFFFHAHTGPFGQTLANSEYNAKIIATCELIISHSIFIRFTWFLDHYEAFIAPEMICTSSTRNDHYFNFLGTYIYILNYLNLKNWSRDWMGGTWGMLKGYMQKCTVSYFPCRPLQTCPNVLPWLCQQLQPLSLCCSITVPCKLILWLENTLHAHSTDAAKRIRIIWGEMSFQQDHIVLPVVDCPLCCSITMPYKSIL